MTDIVLPRTMPASAVASTTAASAAAAASAAISNLPTALVNIAVSALIEGVVVERTGKNTVVVRTDKGILTLHTGLPLKPGSEVKLQVQTLGQQMRVIILEINGKPLAGAGPSAKTVAGSALVQPAPAASSPLTTATNPSGTTAAAPQDTPGLRPGASAEAAPGGKPLGQQTPGAGSANTGTVTPGMVSAATASSPPLTSITAPLTPGMTVVATVVQPTAAVLAATGPLTLLMEENFNAAGRDVPAGSGTTASAPSTNIEAGSRLVIRIAAIGNAASSSATIATGGAGAAVSSIAAAAPATAGVATADVLTVLGTVTTITAAGGNSLTPSPGNTLVRTPLGVISLPTQTPSPVNTPLTLEILGTLADKTGLEAIPGLARQQTLHAFSRTWPALREAIDTIQRTDPEKGNQTLFQAVPRLGPTLANGILFFITALRSGNVRSWIGENASGILENAGRGDLLARLGNDFAQLGRIAGEHQESGWQTLLIPVYDGDKLHQIRMFMRQHGHDDANDGESGSRFVVETELSRLGPIQLDGLIRKKQFDLIIRTRIELPENMRTDIKAIFQDALVTSQFGGSINFQIKPSFEFMAPEDMSEGAADHGVGLVV